MLLAQGHGGGVERVALGRPPGSRPVGGSGALGLLAETPEELPDGAGAQL
jgi:hypothetical protein